MNTQISHRRASGALLPTVALTIVAGFLLTFLATQPAAAVDDGNIGIRPSSESDFFHLTLAAGADIESTAVVSNYTSDSITLLTYPVDAASTEGGFAMADQIAPREGVSAWIRLGVDNITVPPGTEMELPFTLSVPAGTAPGDYAGALIIQTPPEEGDPTQLADGTTVRLDVVQRLGLRIYVNVPGTASRGLQTGDLAWERIGDDLVFSLEVTNTGNTNLKPSALLNLEGFPLSGTELAFAGSDELLTGSTHTLHATLQDAPLLLWGAATATVTSEAGVSEAQSQVLYIPWQLMAAGLLVAAAVSLVVWRIALFTARARRALAQVTGTKVHGRRRLQPARG